jgi:hypothetical protein
LWWAGGLGGGGSCWFVGGGGLGGFGRGGGGESLMGDRVHGLVGGKFANDNEECDRFRPIAATHSNGPADRLAANRFLQRTMDPGP